MKQFIHFSDFIEALFVHNIIGFEVQMTGLDPNTRLK